jgi:hypothetical protein
MIGEWIFGGLIEDHKQKGKQMKTLKKHWNRFATMVGVGVASVILFTALWVWGQSVPQPVLTITSLGSNHFNIVITNAVTTTNYTLFWTPFLEDQNYPWEVWDVADPGTTNFVIDAAGWARACFRVMVGVDRDLDGVPDWRDADPLDPNVGELQVIIYSPANGSTINN